MDHCSRCGDVTACPHRPIADPEHARAVERSWFRATHIVEVGPDSRVTLRAA